MDFMKKLIAIFTVLSLISCGNTFPEKRSFDKINSIEIENIHIKKNLNDSIVVDFSKNDIENFVNEIEKLHTIYIEQTAKELKENSEFVLAVYQKIQDLNLIERYIFISRIKSLRKEKIKQTDIKTAIKHYFKEFLK